jgi:hypothetical protein
LKKKIKKKNKPEESPLESIPFEDAVKRLLQTPPSPKTKKTGQKNSNDKD